MRFFVLFRVRNGKIKRLLHEKVKVYWRYVTKSSSSSVIVLPRRRLVRPGADDDFVIGDMIKAI